MPQTLVVQGLEALVDNSNVCFKMERKRGGVQNETKRNFLLCIVSCNS